MKKELEISYKFRLGIASDVASGMAYMHQFNKVHVRDLRPANILIAHDYTAKICDMGLGRVIQDISKTHDCEIGPNWYMPPEFQSGHYDQKLDVYSFGLTLSDLFGGDHFYNGRIEITEQAPIVWSLVSSCTEYDPIKRPNAQALSDKLDFVRKCISEFLHNNEEPLQEDFIKSQLIFQIEISKANEKYDRIKQIEINP